MRSRRTAWSRAVVAVAVACWGAVVVVPPLLLASARDRRLAEVSSPEARERWDAFRDDMRRQSGPGGPVQRKVPRSPEPPELVWLRDYPLLAIAAWVTLVGGLGGFLAVVATGLANGRPPRLPAEDRTAGGRHDHEQHKRDAEHADERRHG